MLICNWLLLLFLAMATGLPAQSPPADNRREHIFSPQAEAIALDSLSIIHSTFQLQDARDGSLLDTSYYALDDNRLLLKPPALGLDSLRARYRVLPFLLGRRYFHLDTSRAARQEDGLIGIAYNPYEQQDEALLRFRTGSIAYYLPGEGWQKVSGRYGYPNGILVREHHLYIAEGTRKHLLRFDLDEQGHPQPHPIHSARKFLFADNLMPGPEGWLYGTCHPRPLRFKAHAGDPGKRSPSSLYKISPDFEDWEWIGQDDGGRISAASTCLPYHGQLYVSQVFDGFILKMPYTKGQ